MKRLSLMVTEPLFEQIELARGDVPRERWLRRAVERALADVEGSVRVEAHAPGMGDGRDVDSRPAPAEQPETPDFIREGGMASASSYRQHVPGPNVENIRSSFQAKEFRPYPKGGKR